MEALPRYPRTPHLDDSGSGGSPSRDRVGWNSLSGKHVVVEEKVDGAEACFFFDGAGDPRAQSRGAAFGPEPGAPGREWDGFREWLAPRRDAFLERLEDRYAVYGMWTASAHSLFYDALPGPFVEFDVLDRRTGRFLSTAARRNLLAGLDLPPVAVLAEAEGGTEPHPRRLVGPSRYRTGGWREACSEAARRAGLALQEPGNLFEDSDMAEGVYGKVEEGGFVIGRFKWVRPGFVRHVAGCPAHWRSRPAVRNAFAAPVDGTPTP